MSKRVKKARKRPPAFPVLWCRVIIELLLIYQVSSRVCYSDGNLGTRVCQTARSVNVRDQRTFYLCQVLYRKFSEISFNLSHKLVNSSSLHFNEIHDDVIIYDSQMAFHMKCKVVWSWKWPPTLETFEWFGSGMFSHVTGQFVRTCKSPATTRPATFVRLLPCMSTLMSLQMRRFCIRLCTP